jgi:methylphosphotriester-DNA--protein-cysteine methyltransferase
MQIIERESLGTKKQSGHDSEANRRWEAVLSRDRRADGTFVFSVSTTGVYCRPSCASRRAKRENVAFHATPADADRAGFRPCKRCKPNQRSLAQDHAAIISGACRQIETSETEPSLSQLAKCARMSAFHFHRMFRSITGVTPKQYATAHRTKVVQRNLKKNLSVTEAIYDAGFNSNSRFYQRSEKILGMTPSKFRDGGKQVEIKFAVGDSSVGAILVAQSERGVCAILLGDDPDALVRDLQDRFPRAKLVGGDRQFEKLIARVVAFVTPLDRIRPAARHPRNRIPTASMASVDGYTVRRRRKLQLDSEEHRQSQCSSRSRGSLRRKQSCRCDSMPPGRPQRQQPVRLSLGSRAQKGTAATRKSDRTALGFQIFPSGRFIHPEECNVR